MRWSWFSFFVGVATTPAALFALWILEWRRFKWRGQ